MSQDIAVPATAPKVRLIPSTRFVLALLVSFALFIQYAQRVSLSMAIVCMVNKTAVYQQANPNLIIKVLNSTSTNAQTKYGPSFITERQFVWTEFQQQLLLGAYWFGYIFTLVPSGWVSIVWGAKKLFALSLLLSSIATIGIPVIYWIDDYSFYVALVFRVVIGFTHGPLFPATYTFWSMWAVPLERSTLTSIGFCSNNLGTSLTMLVGGLFCRYVTSGWMYTFALTGLFGFIWLPLWMFFVADSPLTHKRITDQERKYICAGIGIDENHTKKKSISIAALPWMKIIRSKPIIALFVTECCNLFGLFFFYTNVGKILTEIHHVPTQYTGTVLAAGFILMPISSLASGIMADNLVRRKIMSLTNVRKMFNSIASFVPAICVLILCFCDETLQVAGVVTVLVLLTTSAAAYGSGYIVNFADVMPAWSSVIFGITTAVATFGALMGNLLAGVLIKQPILQDWRKLFIIFCVIYVIGGLVFLIWGSAEPRSWATFEAQKKQQERDQVTAEPGEAVPLQEKA